MYKRILILLTNHFKTHEEGLFYPKMLTKYIGGKDVISSTRNSISHGRMPGDLKRLQVDSIKIQDFILLLK